MEKVGQDMDFASKCLKDGKLVVFPTETVYGIGAYALDKNAVEKIFKAKNRPADNPLIVHVSSIEMVQHLTQNIGEIERQIIEKFWPGPISIIMKKKDIVPSNVTAGLDTVSIRMPDNNLALKLISKTGPIAAPSANVSGKPSGTSIEDIYEELKENVSYFIDDGTCKVGIESTVIKVENNQIIILRPGKISKEDLKQITENVIIDKNCFEKPKEDAVVLSPGMKHRHYAPKAKCIMLKFDNKQNLYEYITKLKKENSNNKICFMFMDEIANMVKNITEENVINLGKNLNDVSRNIFKQLRNLDKNNIDICYIQAVSEDGIGTGIMNRLIRACEYNIIKI